jgi:hypothetical protein
VIRQISPTKLLQRTTLNRQQRCASAKSLATPQVVIRTRVRSAQGKKRQIYGKCNELILELKTEESQVTVKSPTHNQIKEHERQKSDQTVSGLDKASPRINLLPQSRIKAQICRLPVKSTVKPIYKRPTQEVNRLSQSSKSLLTDRTEKELMLPKIKSHIWADPKFVKSTARLPTLTTKLPLLPKILKPSNEQQF